MACLVLFVAVKSIPSAVCIQMPLPLCPLLLGLSTVPCVPQLLYCYYFSFKVFNFASGLALLSVPLPSFFFFIFSFVLSPSFRVYLNERWQLFIYQLFPLKKAKAREVFVRYFNHMSPHYLTV